MKHDVSVGNFYEDNKGNLLMFTNIRTTPKAMYDMICIGSGSSYYSSDLETGQYSSYDDWSDEINRLIEEGKLTFIKSIDFKCVRANEADY